MSSTYKFKSILESHNFCDPLIRRKIRLLERKIDKLLLAIGNGKGTVKERLRNGSRNGDGNDTQPFQRNVPSKKTSKERLIQSNEIDKNKINSLDGYTAQETRLLIMIYHQIDGSQSLTTNPIHSKKISDFLDINSERARKIIFNISKKPGVTCKKFGGGINSFRMFEMSKELYNKISNLEEIKQVKNNENYGTVDGNVVFSFSDISSSNNININNINIKKTTTTEKGVWGKNVTLPCVPGTLRNDWNDSGKTKLSWSDVDCSPLSHIGLTKRKLRSIEKFTSPDIAQESILQFAFGLKHSKNTRRYDNPLTVICGVLRKGDAWEEPGYKSPLSHSIDRLNAKSQEKKQQLEKIIQEFEETEFPIWSSTLTADEIKKIKKKIPEEHHQYLDGENTGKIWKNTMDGILRGYYKKHVLWPKLKSDLELS